MPEHTLSGAGHINTYNGGAPVWMRNIQLNPSGDIFKRAYLAPAMSSGLLSSGIGSMYLTSVASNRDLPLQYYSSPFTASQFGDSENVYDNRTANPSKSYVAPRKKDETDKDYHNRVFSDTFKGEPGVSVYKMANNGRLPETLQSNDDNDTIYAVRTGSSAPKSDTDYKELPTEVSDRFGGTPSQTPPNANSGMYGAKRIVRDPVVSDDDGAGTGVSGTATATVGKPMPNATTPNK